MFHMKHKVNRGTPLPMKAVFAATPLFLFLLAVAAIGDEPAIEPIASKPGHAESAAARAMTISDRFWTKVEATEAADERNVLLLTISEGAPRTTEAREIADEHKAVLESVSGGTPGTPKAQGNRE